MSKRYDNQKKREKKRKVEKKIEQRERDIRSNMLEMLSADELDWSLLIKDLDRETIQELSKRMVKYGRNVLKNYADFEDVPMDIANMTVFGWKMYATSEMERIIEERWTDKKKSLEKLKSGEYGFVMAIDPNKPYSVDMIITEDGNRHIEKIKMEVE